MKKLFLVITILTSTLAFSQNNKSLVTFNHVANQNNEILQKFQITEIPVNYLDLKNEISNIQNINSIELLEKNQTFVIHSSQEINADEVRSILHKYDTEFNEKTVSISNLKKFHFSKNEN